MTDAERQRLDEIARGGAYTPLAAVDQAFLIELAQRCAAAECDLASLRAIIPTYLTDREAEDDWLTKRDVVLRNEVAKMAAAECVAIVGSAQYWDEQYPTTSIAQAIRKHFALKGSAPTLTERVATECAELVDALGECEEETPASIAKAIRRRFIRPG